MNLFYLLTFMLGGGMTYAGSMAWLVMLFKKRDHGEFMIPGRDPIHLSGKQMLLMVVIGLPVTFFSLWLFVIS